MIRPAPIEAHCGASMARRSIDDLLPQVYEQLRALAARYFVAERPGTLQPTAVVHDAFVRLVETGQVAWRDRAHFFAIAAQEVRRALVDHARRRSAAKRGGGRRRVPLDDIGLALARSDGDLLALEEAMGRLAAVHARSARVVELRIFAGLTQREVAGVLSVSRKTVNEDWSFARSWLSRELARSGG